MEVLVVPAEPEEPDGPEVVRKTATQPDERERLLREADVLRAAAERGVTGIPTVIAAPSPAGADPCLVTAAAAGPSLAVAPPLPILEVAGVVAEVARLLADLHEAGLVHGSVGPGHVVLDGAGGAILVGFGGGGPVGSPSPDPADGPLEPAADVADWGALVGHLLDWSAAGEEEPLVALRRSLADRRPRRGGARPFASSAGEHERRVLAALADQAQDPDPARRPSARSLAAAVDHRIPDRRMPGAVAPAPPVRASSLLDRLAAHVVTNGKEPRTADPPAVGGGAAAEPEPEPPPPARRRRRLQDRVGASSLAEALADEPAPSAGGPAPAERPPRPAARRPQPSKAARLVPLASRTASSEAAGVSGAGEPGAAGPAVAPGANRAALRRWRWLALPAAGLVLVALAVVTATTRPPPAAPVAAPPAACPPSAPPAADVDGDGCEEPVAWVDGVLQAGTARFALGEPGDAWAVGDWDCDGRRTPALLHRGALAVFDTWPGPGAELRGSLVATATGATGLTVVRGPDGCDRPSAVPPGPGGPPPAAGASP